MIDCNAKLSQNSMKMFFEIHPEFTYDSTESTMGYVRHGIVCLSSSIYSVPMCTIKNCHGPYTSQTSTVCYVGSRFPSSETEQVTIKDKLLVLMFSSVKHIKII